MTDTYDKSKVSPRPWSLDEYGEIRDANHRIIYSVQGFVKLDDEIYAIHCVNLVHELETADNPPIVGKAYKAIPKSEYNALKRIAELAQEMVDETWVYTKWDSRWQCSVCEYVFDPEQFLKDDKGEYCPNPDCPAVQLRAALAELEVGK